ncbi:MAG: CCA tRNA nucleotidyltransferase [Nitrospira sp.]|nr:CCA tRNA nucleotidyltransferase [Nitrospira sp.]
MEHIKSLRELRKRTSAEVFLAGGAVRDLACNRRPNDFDFLVRNIAPNTFEETMRSMGDLRLVGSSFGVYLFQPHGTSEPVEIAFPRVEVSTGKGHRDFTVRSDPTISLEEDAGRRDFTLNAMYVSIDNIGLDGKLDRQSILDLHGGLEHIKRRLIVAVGNPQGRFEEDPLRMLRAAVLIARTGYRLEGNTFAAIKRNAGLIQEVSPERIRDELNKIMSTSKPSRAFKMLHRTGLLAIIFPELEACVGCGQNPKHHSYPVFEHSIYAADAATKVTDSLEIRWSALCHDLGKAPTRQVKPGGDGPDDVSFHSHEIVSTNLTYGLLTRLRCPNDFVRAVVSLVRNHQYKYDRTWTDKAVRRFIRNCGITEKDLQNLDQHPQFLLRQADRMGNELKAHLPITQKQRDFQDRIIKVFGESSAHSLRDLKVGGKDLLEVFNLQPSPIIGKTIAYLFDRVEENPRLNTYKELVRLAGEFIKSQETGKDGNSKVEPSGSEQSLGATEGEAGIINTKCME